MERAAASKEKGIPTIPQLIGGEWQPAAETAEVRDPYRGTVVARAPRSGMDDLQRAVAAAVRAKPVMAAMPGYKRAELLRRVAVLLNERVDQIAEVMSRETGKAIKDARGEVARSQDTIQLSAEEAVRIEGEHVPLDASAMGAGKIAFMLRFPVGVVAGITPFNAPFNLACHKVAPAIAAGNSIVLKAPPQSPGVVHEIAKMFVDAGAPAGSVNVLYGDLVGPALVRHPRRGFHHLHGLDAGRRRDQGGVGSAPRGAGAGRRRSDHRGGGCLRRGQRAGAARNAMRLAGQSCISVQNVYVHESLYEAFVARLVQEVKTLKAGDPLDPSTDVGTLIDEASAKRVEAWVREAAEQGARVLAGGRRNGAQVEPTVLVDVKPDMRVVCDEVFGPVVSVQKFKDIDAIFKLISTSRFGLQCGLFTRSLDLAMRAVRSLRTGGVILNGTSTFRTDQLAYGGIKDSGIGREGPKYAIRDMTDERLVVFNL